MWVNSMVIRADNGDPMYIMKVEWLMKMQVMSSTEAVRASAEGAMISL